MASVRRKIVIPVLLAAIVTVFSLRYYNSRKLEKQVAARVSFRKPDHVMTPSQGYDNAWKVSGLSKEKFDRKKSSVFDQGSKYHSNRDLKGSRNVINRDTPHELRKRDNSVQKNSYPNFIGNMVKNGKFTPNPVFESRFPSTHKKGEDEAIGDKSHLRFDNSERLKENNLDGLSQRFDGNSQLINSAKSESFRPNVSEASQKPDSSQGVGSEQNKESLDKNNKINKVFLFTQKERIGLISQPDHEVIVGGQLQQGSGDKISRLNHRYVNKASEQIKFISSPDNNAANEAIRSSFHGKSITRERLNANLMRDLPKDEPGDLKTVSTAKPSIAPTTKPGMIVTSGSYMGWNRQLNAPLGSGLDPSNEKERKISLNNTLGPMLSNPTGFNESYQQKKQTGSLPSETVGLPRFTKHSNASRPLYGERNLSSDSVTSPSLQKIWDASDRRNDASVKGLNPRGVFGEKVSSEGGILSQGQESRTQGQHKEHHVGEGNPDDGNAGGSGQNWEVHGQNRNPQIQGGQGKNLEAFRKFPSQEAKIHQENKTEIQDDKTQGQDDKLLGQNAAVAQIKMLNLTSESMGKSEKNPKKEVNIWNEEITPTKKSDSLEKVSQTKGDTELRFRDLPAKALRSKELHFRYRPGSIEKYAVISAACIGNDYNYIFYLPLTVDAWKRIGYDTIVLLIGSEKHWMSRPVLNYVLKELKRRDPIVLFLNASRKYWVLLSQVSRIFVSELLDWQGLENSVTLLTSDTDIWPLAIEMYELPKGKEILSINSECCGEFEHKGKKYKMLPMCSLVMHVKTWRELIGMPRGLSPVHPVQDMITYLEEEFGAALVSAPVSKGENDGWFMDQHLISVRVEEWKKKHGAKKVQYSPRQISVDRVDRSRWMPYRIERKKDVHLLENLYRPGVWERVLALIRGMFPGEQEKMVSYRDGFIRMLLEQKKLKGNSENIV